MSEEPIDEELLADYMKPYVDYITGKFERELAELLAEFYKQLEPPAK